MIRGLSGAIIGAVFSCLLLMVSPASACGTLFQSYLVNATRPNWGYRCVRFFDDTLGRGNFFWYGEGDWGSGSNTFYRHIGFYHNQGNSGSGYFFAVDIPTYARSPEARYASDTPRVERGGGSLRVMRPWNETWRRVAALASPQLPGIFSAASR